MLDLNKIYNMDCLDGMKQLSDNSVDAVITDPPYGLSFMGKKWDYDVPTTELWAECLRVLKPGGYLLAFAGTRTQHRMAVRIEDAGFEIRDMIAWVYGSGFPKSYNIGKAVDKLQGNKREFVCENPANRPYNLTKGETSTGWQSPPRPDKDKGTSEWEGWGTALKPALEPITVARKPLSEKTVAENCLKWGTGGINIDGSRVEAHGETMSRPFNDINEENVWNSNNSGYKKRGNPNNVSDILGRFPANLIHDGSDEVVSLFPDTKPSKSALMGSGGEDKGNKIYGHYRDIQSVIGHNDNGGSASRFFYCAKASKSERNKGCEELPLGEPPASARSKPAEGRKNALGNPRTNNHPTVKPIALMEYLVKLVSREGALVLDPFAGSGSTLIACKNLNRKYIGFERESDYVEISNKRLSQVSLLDILNSSGDTV